MIEACLADVAELADALDLGSSSERSEGSSPFIRITIAKSAANQQAKVMFREGGERNIPLLTQAILKLGGCEYGCSKQFRID
jgi:hypothetical protein